MDKPIPFFYFDILSRMIPGAATLASLHMIRQQLPDAWQTLFEGQETWKAVVVPLAIAGLCYAIGVLFEAIDYSGLMRPVVWWIDDTGWFNALRVSGDDEKKRREELQQLTKLQVRRYRIRLWDTLVFEGARDTGFGTIFAHCHRYQAEHKMFLHLVYPALLTFVFSFALHVPWWRALIALAAVAILVYVSYRRNERRWLQVLSSDRYLAKTTSDNTCQIASGASGVRAAAGLDEFE